MNATLKELAIGLAMTLAAFLACVIARAAGIAPADLSNRAMLALTGGYLARVGNNLPKARMGATRALACGSEGLAARRFVGWTWALAGSAVVAGACFLPIEAAKTATIVGLLSGVATTAIYWTAHLRTQRPSS